MDVVAQSSAGRWHRASLAPPLESTLAHEPFMILDSHAIDALLPQTQCTQCGFDGCMPYAEAIAARSAPINRCPPGGDDGIRRLSVLTGLPYLPLDPANGIEKPKLLAVIDESRCIGCTICIRKCPVDAIAGAAKRMHTVIADECTGCELCVAPCPVDCIVLVPMPASHPATNDRVAAADRARDRFRAKTARLARLAAQAAQTRERRAGDRSSTEAQERADAIAPPGSDAHGHAVNTRDEQKREAIAAALARARARRMDPRA